jgi:DEAD/DEAH box helicase domain-containing protein
MKTPIQKYLDEIQRLDELQGQWEHHEHISARVPDFGEIVNLDSRIVEALRLGGISKLYSHQVEAIERIHQGENVVVVTPTASGKTEIFNIPITEAILADPTVKALYLFPLKALEQDQLQRFRTFVNQISGGEDITAAIYDGDTTSYQRIKIRRNFPNVIFTNPDMLHQGIMAYHGSWERFFADLRFVVVDELHTYKGIFGSHVVQLFRRLNRICRYYGRSPQYICLSATIRNPVQLAEDLTGRSFQLIERSGAPQPERHFLFLNPDISPNTVVARLFALALDQGLRSIVFTKARVVTELIHRYVLEQRPDLAGVISSYRAGFLPEERREIEGKLQLGEILGVISTSALELGIDIGGLDVCFLVGYPGTVATTWQRGGRVGRKDRPSVVVLIAQQNALDQYFMRHPEDFFGRSFESAIVNRDNAEILKSHLESAAAEIPLMEGDDQFDIIQHKKVIGELVSEGRLLQGASGKHYFAARKYPSRNVSIRSIGETYAIFDKISEERIGEVSGLSVFRECHEGAIYLHRARQYQVVELDLGKRNVWVKQVNVPYYTQVQANKDTEIIETLETLTDRQITAYRGIVKVTEQVIAYEKRRIFSGERISIHPLELPPQTFVGQGIWVKIPNEMVQELVLKERHAMGSIHAVEHATLSLVPLFALCDRNDVGGISFESNPQVGSGVIFLYDGYPGGAGLSWRAFEVLRSLLEKTQALIQDCQCELGCPSCIHSPKCGSGNHPLDKQGAVELLGWILGETFQPSEATESANDGSMNQIPTSIEDPPFIPPYNSRGEGMKGLMNQPPTIEKSVEKRVVFMSANTDLSFLDNFRILTFDLETQLSAEEVGGWDRARLMRVAVGVIHDSRDGKFYTYGEDRVDDLIAHLREGDLVVGFNLIRFDYQVLRGYTMQDFRSVPTLDILKEIQEVLGHRLTLDSVARATLKMQKSGDGLQSLEWFRKGKLDLVTEYCIKDVEITHDLFLYGVRHGYLLFDRKGIGEVRIPVNWGKERICDFQQSK